METSVSPNASICKEEIKVEIGIDLGEDEYYEDFTQCNVHEESICDADVNEDEHNYEMINEAKKLEKLILNLQKLEDHLANFFCCHDCSFETNEKDSYLNHLDHHRKESFLQNDFENMGPKHFQCPKCTFKTYVGQKLLDHLKDHDKVEMTCPNCPYETTNELLLFQHQKLVHSESKDYTCYKCSYKTNNKECFNSHLECHMDTNKCYVCDRCDYKTDRKWNLSQHALVHEDRNLKKFCCSTCSYIGFNKVSYLKHLKKHTNEVPLKCLHCDYTSYEKRALSQHALIHNSVKRYQCPYCTYKSHRNWSLHVHIKKRHANLDLVFLDSEENINVPEEEVIHIIA